jgi:hypothetical protein
MPIAGPSKLFALESTGKFLPFRALTVSTTIDVDWLNDYWSGSAFVLVSPCFAIPSLRRQQATRRTRCTFQRHHEFATGVGIIFLSVAGLALGGLVALDKLIGQ